MTNYEKYRDKLVKFNYSSNTETSEFCNNFVEPNILNPIGKRCLDVDCTYCRMLMSIWLMDEYKEPEKPEVDWSKVAVDTPILVRSSENEEWYKRYFARYENETIYAWVSGRTSWASIDDDDVYAWKYVKLAEREENNEL